MMPTRPPVRLGQEKGSVSCVSAGMTEPTSAQDLFKGRHFDQEIIILCVRWYITFKLSFRDLIQMDGGTWYHSVPYDYSSVGAAVCPRV